MKRFFQQSAFRSAEMPVKLWIKITKAAAWSNPADIKASFNNADILKDGRAIFNIGGNKYRLVAKINYGRGIVYIRFIGSHEQYDRINPNTV